jgi:hypothetical protein
MTTGAVTPYRSQVAAGRESFWHLVHAEWTKFRTVRGWVIAMIVAILVIAAFVFIASSGSSSCHATGAAGGSACPSPPTGPGGEPVNDAFYFVHQPLTGNGTITVQVTSLTGQQSVGSNQMAPGLQPWSKAGIIIKENTSQGSAYAAMMVTASNGVRLEWDYVNDTPGLAGSVSASGFTPAHGYASLTAGADIRAAAGAVLYLTLIALLSLGVTAAVRDSAAAIGLVLGLLYLFPIVASLVSDATLARRLQQIGPLSAGLDAQATIGVKSLPLTPWQGLGVVALWTVGALLLGALVLRSRDA